jgi:diguanylate cyclase (GGDEF)-like protein
VSRNDFWNKGVYNEEGDADQRTEGKNIGGITPPFSMEKHKSLLVITNDDGLHQWIDGFCLQHADVETSFCSDVQQIGSSIANAGTEVLLLDTTLFPDFSAATLHDIRDAFPIMPVVGFVGSGDREAKLQSLSGGARSTVEKPVGDDDEVYGLICNAVGEYRERSAMAREVEQLRARCESDRVNLLELELVKGFQHMIGEIEEPASIVKHGFSLIKNYLAFDVFAALVPRRSEEEIYVYPNVAIREENAEVIPGTLIKKMAKLAKNGDDQVRVVIQGRAVSDESSSDDLKSIIVPLVTDRRTCGYAGICRDNPFDYQEEAVFKRFCSHIATALEKINLFEEIKALSTSDSLTGLFDHAAIVSQLEQEVQRSHRYGSPLSVLMLDIDDFKEVNDTLGHLAGDAVLGQVADLLQSGIRDIDSIGRYGGEEFLVILPETDAAPATLIADRLRESGGEHFFAYDSKTIHISLSGGVASYREGKGANELIRAADENLYKAKKEGKNRVHYDQNQ